MLHLLGDVQTEGSVCFFLPAASHLKHLKSGRFFLGPDDQERIKGVGVCCSSAEHCKTQPGSFTGAGELILFPVGPFYVQRLFLGLYIVYAAKYTTGIKQIIEKKIKPRSYLREKKARVLFLGSKK